MTVVAHQDDDFLFMNPDIDRNIRSGAAHTTVYVTAGDSGGDRDYWTGRENGAKAAYALMAGSATWVDETVAVSVFGRTLTVQSSYLADDPQVRIYFLRLPDGGGVLAPGMEEQLARLEAGDLARIAAIDGSAEYSRADLVSVLTTLMDRHAPSAFQLQVDKGEAAATEHTDHRHTAQLALEALAHHDAGSVTVTQYINYDSRLSPPNLSDADAARTLAIMEAYAAFDPFVLQEGGGLQPVYLDWTQRQYVADTYVLDTRADTAPPLSGALPDWVAGGDWRFSVSGSDAFLFRIGSATGELRPEDWAELSADDPQDDDGDGRYLVTRTATRDGGGTVTQDFVLEIGADGHAIVAETGALVLEAARVTTVVATRGSMQTTDFAFDFVEFGDAGGGPSDLPLG